MKVETNNTERVQRQLVMIVVEVARLQYEAERAEMGDSDGTHLRSPEIRQTAVRIGKCMANLFNWLPAEFIPTAATLREIERESWPPGDGKQPQRRRRIGV